MSVVVDDIRDNGVGSIGNRVKSHVDCLVQGFRVWLEVVRRCDTAISRNLIAVSCFGVLLRNACSESSLDWEKYRWCLGSSD